MRAVNILHQRVDHLWRVSQACVGHDQGEEVVDVSGSIVLVGSSVDGRDGFKGAVLLVELCSDLP